MTGTLTAGALASALVRSLQSLLPTAAGIAVRADDQTIRIDDSGNPVSLDLGTYGAGGQLTQPEALAAVSAVLSTVQDLVSEALTEPWPQVPDGSMALPDATVDDGWIVGLFGDGPQPMARIRIMPLDRES